MKHQHGARRGLVITVAAIAVVLAVAGGVSVAAAIMSTGQNDSRALPAAPSSSLRSTPSDKKKLPTPGTTPTDAVETPIPDPTATDTAPPAPPAPSPAPVSPVSPAARSCATSTVMGVWAHYDDDLIFSNPGLQNSIASGQCVRVLFLTASDAGLGAGYYKSRELGILRAYNVMRGSTSAWNTDSLTLLSGAHLTVFTPQDDPRITIATLRLPDGGVHAKGFTSTGNTSIASLLAGSVTSISPVDRVPALTADDIRRSIAELASAWGANDVDTLIPTASALAVGDHPDHGAAATFTRQALRAVGYPVDHIHYFVGYPSKGLPANVVGETLTRKVDVYRTYAREDIEIACADNAACLARRSFGDWLQRSYAKTDAELAIP